MSPHTRCETASPQGAADVTFPGPDLLGLAPTDLPVQRQDRYDGEGFSLARGDLAAADLDLVAALYSAVQGVTARWDAMREAPDYGAMGRHLSELGRGPLIGLAHQLGHATREAGLESEPVRRVLHDARGGGLTVLLGIASWLCRAAYSPKLVHTCVHAARDHGKLLRSAFSDVDPERRARDAALKPHDMGHFTDKWDGATTRVAGRQVRVQVRSAFRGQITSRCLETAALDRVLYNLINNACRFSADGLVRLSIFAVNPGLTRWVVDQAVSPEQRAWLRASVGADLGLLYRGGLTRGGAGVGLTACAEVQAACFGLVEPEDSVRRGYLGARLLHDRYHAWFHWPTLQPL